ncbi:uncharacterized protein BXIN_2173 [Babesia sp. Xinjiang]|uniref:uncharacterized protein n=1 Tax=Babesia sp. Xinjiang TaxID=462227 RepID=UPI000A24E205|nr:uncharacterized protein BXIN_2173 [Babesia sp. Xinjiang]ORM40418.1 hypothetical protein BXIN_2173 [Babesia sp. Xinjiang]
MMVTRFVPLALCYILFNIVLADETETDPSSTGVSHTHRHTGGQGSEALTGSLHRVTATAGSAHGTGQGSNTAPHDAQLGRRTDEEQQEVSHQVGQEEGSDEEYHEGCPKENCEYEKERKPTTDEVSEVNGTRVVAKGNEQESTDVTKGTDAKVEDGAAGSSTAENQDSSEVVNGDSAAADGAVGGTRAQPQASLVVEEGTETVRDAPAGSDAPGVVTEVESGEQVAGAVTTSQTNTLDQHTDSDPASPQPPRSLTEETVKTQGSPDAREISVKNPETGESEASTDESQAHGNLSGSQEPAATQQSTSDATFNGLALALVSFLLFSGF